MTIDKRQQLWHSFQDKEYRQEFVEEHIRTGLAFQIRLLREARGWTQQEIARRAGAAQETISAWENPNYGHYTLSTLKKLADAFDVALIVRFVPFSELVNWMTSLASRHLTPLSFDEERAQAVPAPAVAQQAGTLKELSIAFGSVFLGTADNGLLLPDITPSKPPSVFSAGPTEQTVKREEREFAVAA